MRRSLISIFISLVIVFSISQVVLSNDKIVSYSTIDKNILSSSRMMSRVHYNIENIKLKTSSSKTSQLETTYAPQQTYPLTGNPNGICATDVDGDGDIDLVTVNYNPSGVTVLLNNGLGIFDNQYSYSAGIEPFFIISKDIDNDSDNDLIVADPSGGIIILFNNGTGDYSSIDEYAAPRPWSLTSVDIDNDNDLDILTANGSTNDISVFYNNGSGQFSTPVQFSTGLESNGISTGDFDNDGDIDVVVAHMNDDKITTLTNTGNGTLESAVTYDVGYWPFNIYVDDLNYDGYVDIATANQGSGDVSVLLNSNGNGFYPNIEYAAGPGCNAIAIEDFNQDCTIDFMTANTSFDNTTLLLNNGNGFFSSAGSFGAGDDAWSICSADFDGDGDLDVATGNWISKDVSVLMNLINDEPIIPVFLVHGLSDDAETWNTMKTWLESNGHQYVYAVDNLMPCGVVGETYYSGNAALLAHYIDSVITDLNSCLQVDINTINIIGHSMGGLISRRYVSPSVTATTTWTPMNVKNLIMMGTPNKGSNLSSFPSAFFKCTDGPAVMELSLIHMAYFNRDYQDDFQNTNYYSFWGTRGWKCGLTGWATWLSLNKPNDGVVSKNSATRDRDNGWGFDPVYDKNHRGEWCHSGEWSYLEDENLFSTYIDPILNDLNPPLMRPMEETPDVPPQIVDETVETLLAGSSITDSFYVEPNGDLTIALFASDSLMSFLLESPIGFIYDSSLPSGDSTKIYFNDSLGTLGFHIENANEGYWHWTADASSATTTVDILVLAGIDNSVVLTIGQNLEYLATSDTLIQSITIEDNLIGVQGLSVTALPIWNGMDTALQISLFDDGLHGDLLANDGTYGALITSLDSGSVEYKITATGVAPSSNINRLVSIFAYSQGPCCMPPFRGNANGGPDDGTLAGSVTVADLVFLVAFMFQGGAEPACMEEADINGSGGVAPISVTDLVGLVSFMFQGGVAPAVCP